MIDAMVGKLAASPQIWNDAGELERAVLAQIEVGTLRVPPYPSVAVALRQLVSKHEYGLKDVLALVATDPALVADVLRCANSAFFGRGTVSSLPQAVTRVGGQQVMRLALVSGLAGVVRTPGPLAALRRQAWETSLASAAVCQVLAQLRKLSSESAFVAGLLHDFGWMIGIAAIEEMLARAPDATARSEAFWSDAVSRCHTALGLALSARWNLPELLRDAIALHHKPARSSAFTPFVELVTISDSVLELLQGAPAVTAESLGAIPMLTPSEREELARVLPEIPELVAAFDCEPQGKAQLSMLTPEDSTLNEAIRPLDKAAIRVAALGEKKRGAFEMLGIAARGWLMSSTEPLPEKQLVQVEIESGNQRLRLWAKVALCVNAGRYWKLECKPFALSSESAQQWLTLARGTA
jgi:HD-like signal output (HDOD) protein